MGHDALINTYVFLFCFSAAYLLSGRRPLLRLSTRVVLVVLLGCGVLFQTTPAGMAHDVIATATIVLNALFLAFGIMDFLAFRNERAF